MTTKTPQRNPFRILRGKKILIGILTVGLISGSVLFVLYILGIIPPWRPGPPVLGTINIFTDKTEYEQGEIVEIIVRNTLDRSIWYNKKTCPPFCCLLQKLENGKWKDYKAIGAAVKDLPVRPSKLNPGEEISRKWNTRIENGGEIPIVEPGIYRIAFDYGLIKRSFTEKTIYSNEFTIKEGISRQIIDKCKEEERFIEEIRSDPACLKGEGFRCVDGWSFIIYYDKRLAKNIEIPPSPLYTAESLGMLEKLKNATIGVYHNSKCNCKDPIGYEILTDDKLEKTNCKNFYRFIEDYNSSCDGCISTWEGGCC